MILGSVTGFAILSIFLGATNAQNTTSSSGGSGYYSPDVFPARTLFVIFCSQLAIGVGTGAWAAAYAKAKALVAQMTLLEKVRV